MRQGRAKPRVERQKRDGGGAGVRGRSSWDADGVQLRGCRRGEQLGAHGSQQAGGVEALRRDAHRRSAPATAAIGLAIRSSDRPRDLHRPALGSLDRCGRSAAQRGRHATPHDVLAANRSTSKTWRAGPTSFRPRAERGEESAGLPGSAGSVADWGGARATSSPARGAPRCDGPCCLALFAALLSSAGRMGPCAFSNQFCRWRFSTGLVRQGQKRAERARFERSAKHAPHCYLFRLVGPL